MASYNRECELKNKKREKQMKIAGKRFSSGKSHKTIEKRIQQTILKLKIERNSLQTEKDYLQEEILFYESELSQNCIQNTQFHSQQQNTMDIPYQPMQSIGMQNIPNEPIEFHGFNTTNPDLFQITDFEDLLKDLNL